MMVTLNNGILSLALDEKAQLTHFENVAAGTGNLIVRPEPIFQVILATGDDWEDTFYARDADLTVQTDGEQIVIDVRALHNRKGDRDVRIRMTMRLQGDQVSFGAQIDNRSGSTVVDFYYPCLGAMNALDGQRPGLAWPRQYGEYHTDIIAELRSSTLRDGLFELSETYPGHLSLPWIALKGGRDCLFLCSRDPQFQATAFRAVSHEEGELSLMLDKMAFVRPGACWEAPECLAALYEGSWQKGAEDYRDWANATWRHRVTPKQWVRDMHGYFLVIEKQQFGDILWPYDQIPALYEQAKSYGCDTLGLFGWYESGHDNMYPDLEVSTSMGGEAKLREGIDAVHKAGGHVTLYYQGHLIDINSPFYKRRGGDVECKSKWFTPYYEMYNKFSGSEFLKNFTRKTFSTACPYCREWQELMAEKADWIHSLGVDGVLYDQIGGRPPTPCFNTAHGHDNPSDSYSRGRVNLLSRIRSQVDTHEGFAFWTENMVDLYAQYIDCVHGTGNYPDLKPGARAAFTKKGGPMVLKAPEYYRHSFPEDLSTVRNWRPHISPRVANYCLCYGFKYEMELRIEKDLQFLANGGNEAWRQYAFTVSQLRMKHRALLMDGSYACDPAIEKANPALQHGLFTGDGGRCLVLWNDGDETLPIDLAGFAASRWESATDAGEGAPACIGPQCALVLFE